jgi:hypothetical protein
MILLDGCIIHDNVSKVSNCPSLMNLIINGRCNKITGIISMTYPHELHPQLRENVGYAFIFRDMNPVSRRVIYDEYASCRIPTFESFCATMDNLDKNECMVIDCFDRSSTSQCYLPMIPREILHEASFLQSLQQAAEATPVKPPAMATSLDTPLGGRHYAIWDVVEMARDLKKQASELHQLQMRMKTIIQAPRSSLSQFSEGAFVIVTRQNTKTPKCPN